MIRALHCLIILLVCSFKGYTQPSDHLPCGTEFPGTIWEHRFQELIAQYNNSRPSTTAHAANYTIPVIFHIVHGGEPVGDYPNIHQEQIQAQIAVLNQDFSGNAYNASDYPQNAFVNWAANQALPSDNLDGNERVKIANFIFSFVWLHMILPAIFWPNQALKELIILPRGGKIQISSWRNLH